MPPKLRLARGMAVIFRAGYVQNQRVMDSCRFRSMPTLLTAKVQVRRRVCRSHTVSLQPVDTDSNPVSPTSTDPEICQAHTACAAARLLGCSAARLLGCSIVRDALVR